jgi:hypothetical protein
MKGQTSIKENDMHDQLRSLYKICGRDPDDVLDLLMWVRNDIKHVPQLKIEISETEYRLARRVLRDFTDINGQVSWDAMSLLMGQTIDPARPAADTHVKIGDQFHEVESMAHIATIDDVR